MKKCFTTMLAVGLCWQATATAGAPGDDFEAVTAEASAVSEALSEALSPDVKPATSPAVNAVAEPTANTPAAKATELGSFAINYVVKFAAFSADVTLQLTPGDTPGSYLVSNETRPRGLARMLTKGGREESVFNYANGRIVPLSYALDDSSDSNDNDTTVRFDWDSGTAYSLYEQTETQLPLDDDVYDRISSDVVAILDLRSGRDPRPHSIAEKNQIRPYEFTYQGEESIETPAGTFRAVKYLRQRIGSSRSVMIWYVPEAGYLPLHIEQLKRGKPQGTSSAVSYSLSDPAASL